MQDQPIDVKKRRLPTGIEARHSRSCALSHGGARCTCEPSYRAFVWDRREKKILRPRESFTGKGALAEAKRWRANALSDMGRGKNITPSKRTLREAAEAWLAGAEADPPTVLNRSGHPYKPSVLRSYRHDLHAYVLEDLGAHRLSDVRRADLQALVDRLVGKGLSGSKVRNAIIPLRVVFRHALERDEVNANPTSGLRLPNGIGRRERAASPSEAAELLSVLPLETGDGESEKPRQPVRPVYATAFYAGLRRGELRALKWSDVDLVKGVITVQRGWDDVDGAIEPKSEKGKRTVPIVALVRDHLTDLKARTKRDGDAFVFGPAPDRPFTPNNVRRAAAKAWAAVNAKRAKQDPPVAALAPIGLHECRHTFVSLMHDAGVSLETIGDFVGHSSTYMTDKYRHLLEGAHAEAARKLDEYLARADTSARINQLEDSREGQM